MFYIIYDSTDSMIKQMHVYSSKKEFNDEWLPKLKQHCNKNNISLSEIGVQSEIIPLGEDEVALEPKEVKDFASWKVITFSSKEELNKFWLSQT